MWIRSVFSAVSWPSRAQWGFAVLLAVAVGGIAIYATRPHQQPGLPPSSSPDALRSSEIQTILEPDAIRAIDNPQFVGASRAGMRDNLSVIGVALGGEAHAFPIAVMSGVEIVNDRLGDTHIAVTW
jgi:hypothetical protein